MAKPTENIPEFARDDLTNPGANVVEPSEGQKDSGWLFNQKPPREYFNWLARATYKWLNYFDEEIDTYLALNLSTRMTSAESRLDDIEDDVADILNSNVLHNETNITSVQLSSGDPLSTPVTFTLQYTKFLSFIWWSWPTTTISLQSTGGPYTLFIENTVNWPTEVLDAVNTTLPDFTGYPIKLINNNQETNGSIRSLGTNIYTASDGKMILGCNNPIGGASTTEIRSDSKFFGTSGIQAGGFMHKI